MEIINYRGYSYYRDIKRDVFNGLTARQKFIPSKYFYDARGSRLFEEICHLPEYYPTRTELSILESFAPDMMRSFQGGDLVELGSGANWKIRMLLDALDSSELVRVRYVPVDVSEAALISASDELLEVYEELKVRGIVADFIQHMDVIPRDRPKIIVFLGSTIGNFDEKECNTFLQGVSDMMNPGDQFLLGLDMFKPQEILEAAYNDSRGITSEFNRNVLNVLNREVNTDFNPSLFDHVAFFNEEQDSMEMHLQAKCEVLVRVDDLELEVQLEKGETIHTEICRKFTRESAERMISEAGLMVTRWFSDPKGWFSIVETTLPES